MFFRPNTWPHSVQWHSHDSEQRIRRPFERPDHRADAPALDQPATGARLPHATGAPQDMGELSWTTHRDHATELAELGRADTRGQGRGRRHGRFSARPPRRGNRPGNALAALQRRGIAQHGSLGEQAQLNRLCIEGNEGLSATPVMARTRSNCCATGWALSISTRSWTPTPSSISAPCASPTSRCTAGRRARHC
jgi:hypothetical protein